MANIRLTSGERYTFGVLNNVAVIANSTDHAEAQYNIANVVKIQPGYLWVSASSGINNGVASPQVRLQNGTYANSFYMAHNKTTITTVTTPGLRTLGNFGGCFGFLPGASSQEPYMVMSSSANFNNRRVLISAGLHTAYRQSAGTFTVDETDHFIEHTAATNQTVTLPSAVAKEAGRQLLITKLNSGGTLTVSASGTDRIVRAGAATPGRRTTQQYAFAQYFCNGEGEWYAAEQGTWAG